MKILYTGFEPFGGEAVNPSYEALRLLPEMIGSAEVLRLRIPTEFGRGAAVLSEALARWRPDCVICVGQAAGRATVTPEVVAINLRDARIPDNAGNQPRDSRVDEDGPAAFFTRLPARRIVERCRARGIPAALSYTAGTFVCNELMYCLLREAGARYPDMVCGFIHVPCAPEQAAVQAAPQPSMTLAMMAEALEIAGEESLAAHDILKEGN